MSTPMVKAEGVQKRFGRLEVLKGVSLEVESGEVVCMIGPSGSGKSTFLRCINHLEKIDAGRLSVDGELVGYRQVGDKIYEQRDAEVCRDRAEIGMVFQRFNLFGHMTALENVIEAPVHVRKLPKKEAVAAGEGSPRPGGAHRQARRLPVSAVRRPAATSRYRSGLGHEAEADAVRRANVGARPRVGR